MRPSMSVLLAAAVSTAFPACREQSPAQRQVAATSPPVATSQSAPASPGAAASQARPDMEKPPSLVLQRGKPQRIPDGEIVELIDYVEEEIEEEDGTSPGGAAVVSLKVGSAKVTLMDGPEGYGSPVGWVGPFRFTLGDAQYEQVELQVERRSKEVVEGSARELRVARRESVRLDGDLHLRFQGHGHKMVMKGGPPSPLMVSVEYRRQADVGNNTTASMVLDKETYYLHPPEEATWRWRDYRVRLLAHEYDSWMKLKVERLQMDLVERWDE